MVVLDDDALPSVREQLAVVASARVLVRIWRARRRADELPTVAMRPGGAAHVIEVQTHETILCFWWLALALGVRYHAHLTTGHERKSNLFSRNLEVDAPHLCRVVAAILGGEPMAAAAACESAGLAVRSQSATKARGA